MQNAAKTLGAGSRALSGLLGLAVIGLALAVLTTPMDVGGVIDWAERIFGAVFILLFAGMVYIALLSIVQGRRSHFTHLAIVAGSETGLQAANGIATLALTYTLLGISRDRKPLGASAFARDHPRRYRRPHRTFQHGLYVNGGRPSRFRRTACHPSGDAQPCRRATTSLDPSTAE